jgi:hypothetical protein
VERQPSTEELDQARTRARADARAKVEKKLTGPAVDEPVVDHAGPYEFAPEDLRAEYERVYERTLKDLRGEG